MPGGGAPAAGHGGFALAGFAGFGLGVGLGVDVTGRGVGAGVTRGVGAGVARGVGAGVTSGVGAAVGAAAGGPLTTGDPVAAAAGEASTGFAAGLATADDGDADGTTSIDGEALAGGLELGGAVVGPVGPGVSGAPVGSGVGVAIAAMAVGRADAAACS